MRGLLITPFAKGFGGVEVMNDYLQLALKDNGIHLDRLAAEDFRHLVNPWSLKIFGLPFASALGFKTIQQHYDFIIGNGEYCFGITHPHTIALFHGSYYGLAKSLVKTQNIKQKLVHWWLSTIQRIAARSTFVLTVSDFNRKILLEQKIQVNAVIQNPVDPCFFQSQSIQANGRCLFVGSYHYYAKGIDHLEHLAQHGIDIDCVTTQIPAPCLGYLGEVSREELINLYPCYDLLIHPSRFESSGLVALEAMASGIPVLINDTGIASDLKLIIPEFVIDFETATLDQIFERIELLRAKRQHFAAMARDYVAKYHSWNHYCQQWVQTIKEVVGDNPSV